MFLSQKGGGVWVAHTGGIATRLNLLNLRGMMSVLSTPPLLLHSSSVFSSVTNSVLTVTETDCACINTLTELKPQITVRRGLPITQQDPRWYYSHL